MDEVSCSDAELVRRTCRGESDAFALLVSRHQDYVYNAVVHLVGQGWDAEDLAQEVFLKAYRSIGGFRRKARFSTWLYGIMLNCVRSHWRRQGRRPRVVSLNPGVADDGPAPDPPSPQDGPLDQAVRSERVSFVRCCIAKLPEELREVIVLRDLEGLSYKELARSLSLPLGTVKSRLFRARRALRARIVPVMADEL